MLSFEKRLNKLINQKRRSKYKFTILVSVLLIFYIYYWYKKVMENVFVSRSILLISKNLLMQFVCSALIVGTLVFFLYSFYVSRKNREIESIGFYLGQFNLIRNNDGLLEFSSFRVPRKMNYALTLYRDRVNREQQ